MVQLAGLSLLAALAGCGSSTDATDAGATDAAATPDSGSSAQLPPTTGRVAIEAWLAAGSYRSWRCEMAPHPQRSPSPHGINRICSNDLLAGHAGTAIVGYDVYRHVTVGTTGATWYWYERVPAAHPAPHDTSGVVADGLGNSGPAMAICVGCHAAAGVDAMHSGHDFVYTRVP